MQVRGATAEARASQSDTDAHKSAAEAVTAAEAITALLSERAVAEELWRCGCAEAEERARVAEEEVDATRQKWKKAVEAMEVAQQEQQELRPRLEQEILTQ